MPSSTILRRLGVFVEPGFLEPAACSSIHTNVRAAPTFTARVRHETDGFATSMVDDSRRTKIAVPASWVQSSIEERLAGLQPTLEAHFHMRLTGFETPQFLVYKTG